MKHIFTIHSPITFLCAYGVIQLENLKDEDIIILSNGYKAPLNIGKIVPAFQDIQSSFWQKIKNWNVPNALDAYIKKLIGREHFIAYIDLMSSYQRLLVTHQRCKEFHFLEEGTFSYALAQSFDLLVEGIEKSKEKNSSNIFRAFNWTSLYKSLIRVARGYTLPLLGMPFNPQSYANLNGIKYFTFSEECFPAVNKKKKRIINFELDNPEIKKMAKGMRLESAILWVEESYAYSYNLPENIYTHTLEKFVPTIIQTYQNRKHYLKLRPKQDQKSSILLKILNDFDIDLDVLDNDIMIEPLLIRSKNCIVVGCVSSALFYSAIYGHKAFSIYDLIPNKPTSMFDNLNSYWNIVERISLTNTK